MRPIVIRTPANHRLEPIRMEVTRHQQIRAGLRRAIRTRRRKRRLLRERPRLDRPIHLISRHLQIPQTPLPRRLQQHMRALHVRHDELLRTRNRPIHMRLRREIHHRLSLAVASTPRRRILDRTVHEPYLGLDLLAGSRDGPAYVNLSSTVTWSPCSDTRSRTNVDPMNPAPPHTNSSIPEKRPPAGATSRRSGDVLERQSVRDLGQRRRLGVTSRRRQPVRRRPRDRRPRDRCRRSRSRARGRSTPRSCRRRRPPR